MKLNDEIGAMTELASRGGYRDGLVSESISTLGASHWNRLSGTQKHAYLGKTMRIVTDNPDADPHIFDDDPSFQEAVISGVEIFIKQATEQFSDNYLKSNAGWPKDLQATINGKLGSYRYSSYLEGVALYQNNKLLEKSKSRRYDEKDAPKRVPISIKARKHTFAYYDQIKIGVELLKKMSPKEQHEFLMHALPSNTLSGHPSFRSETAENALELTDEFCEVYGLPKVPEVDDVDDKGSNIKRRYITVQYIEDLIKAMHARKIFPPFMGLFRTAWDKVRVVLGGSWICKLYGCVFTAAKHLAYRKDVAVENGIPVNEDKYDLVAFRVNQRTGEQERVSIAETKVYCINNLPYISQLNWDVMFELYRDKLPPWKDGKLEPVSDTFIKEKFGVNLPSGEYLLNVIGDDYSKFDTTVIPEDVEWLQGHLYFGWVFAYFIDLLRNSKVWIGDMMIDDIFYKSGFPFTANFGTDIHHNRNHVACAIANANAGGDIKEITKKDIRNYLKMDSVCDVLIIDDRYFVYFYCKTKTIRIIGDTNQSDDSILFVIGLTLDEMEKILSKYGLIIKSDESSDFGKYGFVTFLQMHIGWLLKAQTHTIVLGNLISRYAKMAHSERDLEDESDQGKSGMFRITDNADLDAALSKLASGGRDSESIWIRPFCAIVKNTVSGQKLIRAIGEIDPTRAYELYRSDVMFGMNPSFMGKINVRDYEVSDWLHKAVKAI